MNFNDVCTDSCLVRAKEHDAKLDRPWDPRFAAPVGSNTAISQLKVRLSQCNDRCRPLSSNSDHEKRENEGKKATKVRPVVCALQARVTYATCRIQRQKYTNALLLGCFFFGLSGTLHSSSGAGRQSRLVGPFVIVQSTTHPHQKTHPRRRANLYFFALHTTSTLSTSPTNKKSRPYHHPEKCFRPLCRVHPPTIFTCYWYDVRLRTVLLMLYSTTTSSFIFPAHNTVTIIYYRSTSTS